MSEFNIDEFMVALNTSLDDAAGPEAVDAIFSAMAALPAAQLKAIGRAIEQDFIPDEDFENEILENGPAAVKQRMQEDFINQTFGPDNTEEAIRYAQIGARVAFHAYRLLGDEATPLLKSFVSAAFSLTEAEYNSAEIVSRPSAAVVDAIAEKLGVTDADYLPAEPAAEEAAADDGEDYADDAYADEEYLDDENAEEWDAEDEYADEEEDAAPDAFEIDDFIYDLQDADTVEEVDDLFAPVFALPAAERAAAADAIEDAFVTDFGMLTDSIRENGFSVIKKSMKEDFSISSHGETVEGDEAVMAAQRMVQILYNIKTLQGRKAAPLVKAFMSAAAKLTDAEYNTEDCLLKPMDAVVDFLAKKEGLLKPNPFRPTAKKKHAPGL